MSEKSVCIDVDECKQVTCEEQAVCSNTFGSYSCDKVTVPQTTTHKVVSTTEKPKTTNFR